MWVVSQVGHADSKTTTEVYARLQQRGEGEAGSSPGAGGLDTAFVRIAP